MARNVIVKSSEVKASIEIAVLELEQELNHFLDKAILERAKLVEGGMPLKQANKTILDMALSAEDFSRTFSNRMDGIVSEIGKQTVAKPVNIYSKDKPNQKYEWVLGTVKTSHCTDCNRLSKMTARTLDEWRAEGVGLPREGQTKCNVGCKCMLRPVDN